jgi:hypothetical protein
VVAMLVVVATMGVALRSCGRIEGIAAGLLLGTFAASPFIESFTLSGELLASLPSVLSLLAFTVYARSRHVAWLALAGLLTGCAVLIKQSAFDGGLAAVAFLLVTERRRGLRKAAVLVGAALLPVALAASTAPNVHDWWSAVVAYRGEGDSLVTDSPLHRLSLLGQSLPAAAKGIGLLVMLTAIGWRASPLLPRLWLGAALIGVLGGGNFHAHYYIQLVPPLSLLAAVGLRRVLVDRRPLTVAACGATAAATVAITVPLLFASPRAQARAIWPNDRHLVHSDALASYLRARTRSSEPIYVLWGGADLYYLADRRSTLRYMWYRNVKTVDGALASARRSFAQRRPALIVVVQPPETLDRSGATARILRREYRLATRIGGMPILERRRRST